MIELKRPMQLLLLQVLAMFMETMASSYNSGGSNNSNVEHCAAQRGLGEYNLSDTSSMANMITAAATSVPLMGDRNSSQLALSSIADNYLQNDDGRQLELQQDATQSSLLAQTISSAPSDSGEPLPSTGPYPMANAEQELDGIVNVTREFPMDYAMVMFGYMTPVVLIITIITNTLVVMVLYQRHMRTPTNIVLFTMAIVDLGTLLTPSPWYLYIYTFGNHDKFLYPPAACYAHYIMTDVIPIFFHTSSIWLALLLASQRYIYVCHPTLARTCCTVPRVKSAIFLILSIAFLHQLTHFFDNTFTAATIFYQGKYHNACRNANANWVSVIHLEYYYMTYFMFRIFFVYLIPCVALITLNYLLFRALKRAENKRSELLRTKFKLVGAETLTSYNESNGHRKGNCHANHPRHNYSITGYEVAREVSSYIGEPSSGTNFHAQVPLFVELHNHTRPSAFAGIIRNTAVGPIGKSEADNRCAKSIESVMIGAKGNRKTGASGLRATNQQEDDNEPASAIESNSSQEFSSASSAQEANGLDQPQAPPSTNEDRTHSSGTITNQLHAAADGERETGRLHQGRDVDEQNGLFNSDEGEEEGNSDGGDDDDENEDEDEEEGSSICAECASYDRQSDIIEGATDLCPRCSAALLNDDSTTITAACEQKATGNGGSSAANREVNGRHRSSHKRQQHGDHICKSHIHHQPVSLCSSILGGATNTTSNTNDDDDDDDDMSSSCLVITRNASSSMLAATQCGGQGNSVSGAVTVANCVMAIDSTSIRADEASVAEEDEELVDSIGSTGMANETDKDGHGQDGNGASGLASQQEGLEREKHDDELATSGSADSRTSCNCLPARTGPFRRMALFGKTKARRAKQGDMAIECSNSDLSIKSLKRYLDATSSRATAMNPLANQGQHRQATAPINANDVGAKQSKLSGLKWASRKRATKQNCLPSNSEASSLPSQATHQQRLSQVSDQRRLMSTDEQAILQSFNSSAVTDNGKSNAIYGRNQLGPAAFNNSHSTTANSHSTVSLLQVQDSASNRTSNGGTNRALLNCAASSASMVKRQRMKSPSFASSIGSPGARGGGSGGGGGGGGSRATLVGSTAIPMVVSSNGHQGAHQAAATTPAQSMRTMDSNRTTLMLVVVVSVFLVVEVPAAIVTITHVVLNLFDLSKDYAFWSKLNYIKLFTNFFIMISYSVNFTIYCSMSKKFRETFRDLWFCGPESKRKRARQSLCQTQQQHSQHITANNNH